MSKKVGLGWMTLAVILTALTLYLRYKDCVGDYCLSLGGF
jgi:hypothetical protein